ncbi:adenylate/guanylate cyclase domain-containing protein [Fulvivirga sedimenti]|uniref:2Fe-2S iron-sulfur cluster binding domain-containing protein n=1 Tax=Fulvivirga sedimenti TaxID=2879465 RepID=A0A9X1KZ61_9BACT|nr:adenylate/guanylate cyclase domain-containing protein [Fulvivirga sedimenti]MCA6074341.1 2Fe-2S iron-sulfur cluster binding domain-containing protein [Fulvivirga sedimenti]
MSESTHPVITYTGINQEVICEDPDATLLEVSISNQIPHLHECGGNGQCTTCRVRVIDGHSNLSPRTMKEHETARLRKWDPSIRLACQCYPKGDVSIQRLVWTSSEVNKLQLEMLPDGDAEERAIAILFCDIRNFTKMAVSNNAFDVAHILNRFYTVIGDPILFNNGVIYQYVGDEIIGLFGVSGGLKEKNCTDAVRAALGMYYAIERLNHLELVDFDIRIQMGIGINFGKAFIGHLGHPKHKQFAVIGDPVNTASRIQNYNKVAGTHLLVSESIFKAVPEGTFDIGQEFQPQLAGHEHETKIYEIKGFKNPDIKLALQSSMDYLLRNEDEFASQFYERVFEKSPETRSLFKKNMKDQGRLLTHMLGGIIYSMSRPENLDLGLKFLGESHSKYGVTQAHYPIVMESLMETIEDQLGEFSSPELLNAWRETLTMVTDQMRHYSH